jgi:hypothetical protein
MNIILTKNIKCYLLHTYRKFVWSQDLDTPFRQKKILSKYFLFEIVTGQVFLEFVKK